MHEFLHWTGLHELTGQAPTDREARALQQSTVTTPQRMSRFMQISFLSLLARWAGT
jgi:hypothetical protein